MVILDDPGYEENIDEIVTGILFPACFMDLRHSGAMQYYNSCIVNTVYIMLLIFRWYIFMLQIAAYFLAYTAVI